MSGCEQCNSNCILNKLRTGITPSELAKVMPPGFNSRLAINNIPLDRGNILQMLTQDGQSTNWKFTCKYMSDNFDFLGNPYEEVIVNNHVASGDPIQQQTLEVFATKVGESQQKARLNMDMILRAGMAPSISGLRHVINGRDDGPNSGANCLDITSHKGDVQIYFKDEIRESLHPDQTLTQNCSDCYYRGSCPIKPMLNSRARDNWMDINELMSDIEAKGSRHNQLNLIMKDYLIGLISGNIQLMHNSIFDKSTLPVFVGSTALLKAYFPNFYRYGKDIDMNGEAYKSFHNKEGIKKFADLMKLVAINSMDSLVSVYGTSIRNQFSIQVNNFELSHRDVLKARFYANRSDESKSLFVDAQVGSIKIANKLAINHLPLIHPYPDEGWIYKGTLAVPDLHVLVAQKLYSYAMTLGSGVENKVCQKTARIKDLADVDFISSHAVIHNPQLYAELNGLFSRNDLNSRVKAQIKYDLLRMIKDPNDYAYNAENYYLEQCGFRWSQNRSILRENRNEIISLKSLFKRSQGYLQILHNIVSRL